LSTCITNGTAVLSGGECWWCLAYTKNGYL